jgi:Predicted CoA-binding protein
MRNICDILKESKTIAVVGISDKPARDSGRIAYFLKNAGYDVYGVHPVLKEFAGITIYKSLKDIPAKIDIVDVFINSNLVPNIIPDVLEIEPKVLWLQLQVRNDEAVKPAIEKGIQVVQDVCIAVEYQNCGL